MKACCASETVFADIDPLTLTEVCGTVRGSTMSCVDIVAEDVVVEAVEDDCVVVVAVCGAFVALLVDLFSICNGDIADGCCCC